MPQPFVEDVRRVAVYVIAVMDAEVYTGPTPELKYHQIYPWALNLTGYPGHGGNFIGGGSCIVFAISTHVAFKTPWRFRFDDECSESDVRFWTRMLHDGEETLRRERELFPLFESHSPLVKRLGIMQPCLCVPEGIFMPRMKCDLSERLSGKDQPPISTHRKVRWSKQLTSAAAWLESIGRNHGDLRPLNILVDFGDNLIISDLGSSVPIGEDLESGAPVFCPMEFTIANSQSELFAIGWCLYNIFHGSVPKEFSIEEPQKVVFPKTDHIPFGAIVKKCWYNDYPSVAEAAAAVSKASREELRWYETLADHVHEIWRYLVALITRPLLLRKMRKTHRDLQNGWVPTFGLPYKDQSTAQS